MAARIGSPQIRRAYRFLIEAEQAGRLFTQEELARASGWKATTTEAYVTKKLRPYLEQDRGHFKCSGLSQFTEENFCRLCSQTSLLASDPRKPLLPPR